MEIPQFDDLPVTTMTCIGQYSGTVFQSQAFNLLNVAFFNINRDAAKTKVRYSQEFIETIASVSSMNEVPGYIISLRYRNSVRGLSTMHNNSYFRNSLTLDIIIGKKLLNIKIYKESLVICGSKKLLEAKTGIKLLFDELKQIQTYLDFMATGELYEDIMEIVKRIVSKYPNLPYGLGSNFRGRYDKFKLLFDDDIDYCEEISALENKGVPAGLIDFLLNKANDYGPLDEFLKTMNKIGTQRQLITDNFVLHDVETIMYNINCNMGSEIYKNDCYREIKQIIDNSRDELSKFYIRYHNIIHRYITVTLPYDIKFLSMKHSKKTIPQTTFLIYKSGLVTISGPCTGILRQAYYAFMRMMQMIFPKISYNICIPNIPCSFANFLDTSTFINVPSILPTIIDESDEEIDVDIVFHLK